MKNTQKILGGVALALFAVLFILNTSVYNNDFFASIQKERSLEEEQVMSLDVKEGYDASPEWLQEYFDWHAEQRKNNFEGNKFLIVTCKHNCPCGGISDRIRSMPYWLLAAYKTNRVFLIKWERFNMEDFLVPPPGGLDWRVPDTLDHKVEDKPHAQASCRTKGDARCREFWDMDYDSKPVVYAFARKDLYGDFEDEYFRPEYTPQGSFRAIMDIIFEPSPPLALEIANTMKQLDLKKGQYQAAHFRYNYPSIKEDRHMRMPDVLSKRTVNTAINCAAVIAGTADEPVYFTSDTEEKVQFALSTMSPFGRNGNPIRVVGIEGVNRGNIADATEYSHPSEFYPAFVDLWLFRNARCVTHGEGGYGVLGARLSGNTCVHRYQNHFSWTLNSCPPIESVLRGELEHVTKIV